MKTKFNHFLHHTLNSRISRLGTAAIIVIAVALLGVITARAVTILSVAGFADFSYGSVVNENPTDGRPESKIWWNDGSWWGNLYNSEAGEYQIYRLDWDTQNWVSTGVTTDGREESRADVLWDDVAQKLYVVSHFKLENPSETNVPANWARLFRYSYDSGSKTYSLDAGFGNSTPVRVNKDKTRTVVLDKDSTGRLWVTFVSKAIGGTNYKVYVNYTTTSGVDTVWGGQYALPFPEATVNTDAISSVVAFTDDDGPKIGVVWSNELDTLNRKFYFATRLDSSDPSDSSSWTLDSAFTSAITVPSNDHIDIVKATNNQLFFAFKTEAIDPGQPFIAALARDTDGTYYFHSVSMSSNDTRPIIVYDEGSGAGGDEYVYVFIVSNPAGGVICYVRALVTSPLSAMSFTPQSCTESAGGATKILADATLYTHISNVNSTRQILNDTTDIVVIGADQTQTTYVHGVVNTHFPYVTSVQPAPDSMVGDLNPLIRAVFSQNMDGDTLNTSTFTLVNSLGPVTGTVVYSDANRWVTFTPDAALLPAEIYTATLSVDVTNPAGQPLLNTPYSWSFLTPAPPAAFNKTSPTNGAINVAINPTLTWGSSIGATSYEYCYATTTGCTSWISVGTNTSVGLSGLLNNQVYYWQVRALNTQGTTPADNGVYWSFTTIVAPPGAFNKTSPTNGAINVAINPTLTWGSSIGATSYEYCYATTTGCTSWISVGTNTSVGLSGLLNNQVYYWQVRAVNTAGNIQANGGVYWSFTTIVALPGAFNKTSPSNGAIDIPINPTLSWETSSNATSYEYCYATTTGCTNWTSVGTDTSVGLSGLLNNQVYYWQVRAVNTAGNIQANGGVYWSFTTGDFPLSFSKTAPADGATGLPNNPTLSWGTSTGATSYDYCYATTNPCNNWTSTGLTTSANLSGLAQGTTYYWHVRANNATGTTYSNGSATATWSFRTLGVPGAFEKTSPADGAINVSLTPTLTWGSSSDATKYEYCYDTTNDNACSTWVDNGSLTSATLSGLSENTDYYWHVRAINSLGTTYSNGSETAFWSFKTLVPPLKIYLPLIMK